MLKVLAILIAVWAANDYGVSNLVHNTYLFDAFGPLNNAMILSRHRRDIDELGSSEEKGVCCTGDISDFDGFKEMKKVIRRCVRQFPFTEPDIDNQNVYDCEKANKENEILFCQKDCIARAFNVTDENGNLNRKNVIKYHMEYSVGDMQWKKDALEGYVDDCLIKVEKRRKQNGKCSNVAENLDDCMASKFLNGCPAEMRSSSWECNLKRKRAEFLKF